MVSERTRNIFEYLCAVLNDGLASLEDVRKFIGGLRDLSDNEALFLEGAFMEDPFRTLDKQASSGPAGPARGPARADTEA
ncbi:MAG: hypothetical protein ACYTKD_21040 [Planctomycetota bacterium]|jgi:hypothetical protein